MKSDKLEETELAMLIGKITMEWNLVQDAVRYCFLMTMSGDVKAAAAILDAIKSDDTQRNVTLAAIQAAFDADDQIALRTKAAALLNSLGELSGKRNAFVHSSWTREGDGPIEVSAFLKKPHGSIHGMAPIAEGVETLRRLIDALDQVRNLIAEIQSAKRLQAHPPQSNPTDSADQARNKDAT